MCSMRHSSHSSLGGSTALRLSTISQYSKPRHTLIKQWPEIFAVLVTSLLQACERPQYTSCAAWFRRLIWWNTLYQRRKHKVQSYRRYSMQVRASNSACSFPRISRYSAPCEIYLVGEQSSMQHMHVNRPCFPVELVLDAPCFGKKALASSPQ